MSSQSQPKISSKNLSYSSDLPPFLARLRGQHQQQRDSDSPDPILAARRRAARPRSASEEAEDAPVVVDENGNTVTFPSGADEDGPETKDARVDSKDDAKRDKDKEKIAGIGASKKRKVGRVVGGGEDDEEDNAAKASSRSKEDKHAPDSNPKDTKSTMKQGKKKAKKVKLSFGDDGD
ncbi:hypothetical protein F5Y05DRAFT_416749 [Hypoxylon sp. FL0543]|nr:hypothetical protein F5Y05DRAFT_416749 [Hypoxylon sp. FL0543]